MAKQERSMYSGVSINPEKIPFPVREVMARLVQSGFSAYLVGGVVRDMVQGRDPRDYDIATSATPDQVGRLFEKVAPTGERHGTVTILSGGLGIEVTTLRRDGSYSDSRRPDTVHFTDSLKEDLSRRDFTINSLAAGPEGRVYDFFGGLRDLDGCIIRAVGDPEKRFREDALRMMRALRLACQLGFTLEEKTLASIRACRRLIARVSMERIQGELNGILLSPTPRRGVDLLNCCGLMGYIIPEIDGGRGVPGSVPGFALEVLRHTPARLNVRLAALLFTMGAHCFSPENGHECRYRHHRDYSLTPVGEILDRLKYDRRTVRSVTALLKERITGIDSSREKDIKKFISRVGVENLGDLFDLWRAAAAAGEAGETEAVGDLEKKAENILIKNLPLEVSDLDLNGNDLQDLGIRPGREMGRLLHRLLDIVLENPELNKKDTLLEMVKRWKST